MSYTSHECQTCDFFSNSYCLYHKKAVDLWDKECTYRVQHDYEKWKERERKKIEEKNGVRENG